MHKLKIKPKFAIVFIIVSVFSTTVGGLAIHTTINSLLKDTHGILATEFAKIERDRIKSAFINDINIARLISVDKTLLRWVANENNPSLKVDSLTVLDNYAKQATSGRCFYIIDQTKNYYTNSNGNTTVPSRYVYTVDTSEPSSFWYVQSVQTTEEYLFNLDADEIVGDEVNIYINMPVRQKGKVIGLTGTSTPISDFVKDYSANKNFKSHNIIFNSEGDILVQHGHFFLDKESAKKSNTQARGNFFEMIASAEQQTTILQDLKKLKQQPENAISLHLSFGSEEWITGISYIKELDWYTAASIKANHSLTSKTINVSFGVFISIFFVALIILWIAIQRLIIRRVKTLHRDTINRYAQTDEGQLQDTGDEILSLKDGFDWMHKKIRAHIQELEDTVRIRTQELEDKNRELSEISITDSLTQLYNRRGLFHRFFEEYRRAQRAGTKLGVIILDIDNFKQINDKYGHSIGDQMLVEIGNAIRMRDEDIQARWGGEEFVVISVNTDKSSLLVLLKRLLENVRNAHIDYGNKQLNCTVSIGATCLAPQGKKNFSRDELREIIESGIDLADNALYSVKNSGKDGYRFADSSDEVWQ